MLYQRATQQQHAVWLHPLLPHILSASNALLSAQSPLPLLPPLQPQDVAVVKTQAFGTVLVLDGAIQCTDRDEFSYQVHTLL